MTDVVLTEIRELGNELRAEVAGLRKANDEMLAAKADQGAVDALLVEEVEKRNAAVGEAEDRLKARIDKVERTLELGGGAKSPNAKGLIAEAPEFAKLIAANGGPRDLAITPEQLAGYQAGFERYLRRDAQALPPQMQADMNVGSQPEGGYLVAPAMTGRIVERRFETSPMRQICAVTTISTDALEGATDLNEADAGWVGERAARPKTSTPDVGKYRIPVHEIYAMPRATQKVLDDAFVDVEGWLGGKVADKFARTENAAFVNGDGVDKPRGFLSYPVSEDADAARSWGTLQIVKTGVAGDWPATDPGDVLIDLVGEMKAAHRQNARWAMTRRTRASVRKLKDGQGNYLWVPDFTSGTSGTLLGYGISELEDMPEIADTALAIAFGDFAEAYQIVDRAGVRVLRDPYTDKPWVLFYSTARVGGDVVHFEALKLLQFAA